MLRFNKYLKEAVGLRPGELLKPNSKTGEKRTDILRNEIKAGRKIELTDKSKVQVANVEDVLAAIDQFERDQKPFSFLTTDGQTISSSNIAKSAVFGGGAGAGGGTENTAVVESGQCVWLQAMLDHGYQNDIDFFTDDILKNAYSKVDVGGTTIDQILDMDDSWKKSSYLTGQFLIKNNFVNKNMTFHRDSKTMKAIYNAKNIAFKNNGYAKFSDDKWNPGDIWAVANDFNVKNIPTDSVKSLNRFLLGAYVDRKLVGISLKKVIKKLKYAEVNVDYPPDVDDHRVIKVSLETNKGSFWSNKSGFIEYDSGKMVIAANAYLASNKVEIIGKTARGGGAGWGAIQHAALNILKKKLPNHPFIKGVAVKAAKGDKRALTIVWTLTKMMYPNMKDSEFFEEIAKKDPGWISAKLGALYLTSLIQANMGTKANRFVTNLVNYAGSKSEDASAYIKVYE